MEPLAFLGVSLAMTRKIQHKHNNHIGAQSVCPIGSCGCLGGFAVKRKGIL
jgi:hypothetical protein